MQGREVRCTMGRCPYSGKQLGAHAGQNSGPLVTTSVRTFAASPFVIGLMRRGNPPILDISGTVRAYVDAHLDKTSLCEYASV